MAWILAGDDLYAPVQCRAYCRQVLRKKAIAAVFLAHLVSRRLLDDQCDIVCHRVSEGRFQKERNIGGVGKPG